MRKCTVLWLHEYIQPSNLSSALMLPSAFGLHFLSRLKGLSSSKAEQHTYFEITFVDFTNVFTHSSDTLYLNIVKCHTSFCIPISKMTSFICKKKTFILRPFLAKFEAKVTRIKKRWMDYCEDSTKSWEHLNFPTHFKWHAAEKNQATSQKSLG